MRLQDVIDRCAYPGFRYLIEPNGNRFVLRVEFAANDVATGVPTVWKGRKWTLSPHMTDGEIVQTAWLATMTAIEHEARERFTYRGVSVFDPHYDIEKLVELRRAPDAIKVREEPVT
jgi:hypothetical protein